MHLNGGKGAALAKCLHIATSPDGTLNSHRPAMISTSNLFSKWRLERDEKEKWKISSQDLVLTQTFLEFFLKNK